MIYQVRRQTAWDSIGYSLQMLIKLFTVFQRIQKLSATYVHAHFIKQTAINRTKTITHTSDTLNCKWMLISFDRFMKLYKILA